MHQYTSAPTRTHQYTSAASHGHSWTLVHICWRAVIGLLIFGFRYYVSIGGHENWLCNLLELRLSNRKSLKSKSGVDLRRPIAGGGRQISPGNLSTMFPRTLVGKLLAEIGWFGLVFSFNCNLAATRMHVQPDDIDLWPASSVTWGAT